MKDNPKILSQDNKIFYNTCYRYHRWYLDHKTLPLSSFSSSNPAYIIDSVKAVCAEIYNCALNFSLSLIVKGLMRPSPYFSQEHKVKLLYFVKMKKMREQGLNQQWWRKR